MWQEDLNLELSKDPDPYKIIWFVVKDENDYIQFLNDTTYKVIHSVECKNYNTFFRRLIKSDWDEEAIILNLYSDDNSTKKESEIRHNIVCSLKDGCCTVTNYQGFSYQFKKRPHVVVFSRSLPDYTKISKDRMDIRRIPSLN